MNIYTEYVFLRILMIIFGLVFIITGLFLVIVPFLKKGNPVRQWFIKVSGATTNEIAGLPEIIVGILLIIMGGGSIGLTFTEEK